MCGRFSLTLTPAEYLELFGLAASGTVALRYNVAPTQAVPVVRSGRDGRRELALLRWGLIPSWAEDPRIGNSMINARCETVAVKPAFRQAFRQRRCLVPARGFFEWQKEGSRRLPCHITFRDRRPMVFAGVWERWEGPEQAIESFAIITTEACPLVRPLHDRMPAVLRAADFPAWLDPSSDLRDLHPLLVPYAGDDLILTPVSTFVNNPSNEGPECLAPAPVHSKR